MAQSAKDDRPDAAARVGYWAAVCAAGLAIAYDLGQILEWGGLLGSNGGPESSSTPFGLVLLLTPSLLLGSAFLVMMAALHRIAPAPRKVFTQTALAFATAYATLTGLVYFVQLTLVAPAWPPTTRPASRRCCSFPTGPSSSRWTCWATAS